MPSERLPALLQEVRSCTLCASELPLGPRPVLQVPKHTRILIVGREPGTKVHATGIPFNDPSGDRLRTWMGIDREIFYDASRIALLPMAFCYPGRGKGGDLPPPRRCAETWRTRLLAQLDEIELTIALGQHAVGWHLSEEHGTLTRVMKRWRETTPELVPMPHPSPRNNRWLRNNPWFEAEVVPWLRTRVRSVLAIAS